MKLDISQGIDSFLSEAQRRFVEAYVVVRSIGVAARMVDISHSTAKNWLSNTSVIAGIRLAEKQLRGTSGVTPEEVIMDLRLIRDMALGRIPTPKVRWLKDDAAPEVSYVYDVDYAAANKAVENMGRVVGMFTDKKEIVLPASGDQLVSRLEDLLGMTLKEVVNGECTRLDRSAGIIDIPLENEAQTPLHNASFELHELFEELADKELTSLVMQAGDESIAKLGRRGFAGAVKAAPDIGDVFDDCL